MKLSLRLANTGNRAHWPLKLYVVHVSLTTSKNLHVYGLSIAPLRVNYSDSERSFKVISVISQSGECLENDITLLSVMAVELRSQSYVKFRGTTR